MVTLSLQEPVAGGWIALRLVPIGQGRRKGCDLTPGRLVFLCTPRYSVHKKHPAA
jgi:hypothetical protein